MTETRTVRLRPPRNPVERRAVTWWTTRALAVTGAAAVLLAVLALLIGPLRPWLIAALVLVVAGGVAYAVAVPRIRYRVHRWEVTLDAVYARRGWFFQQWRIAPMSRIQTVDTVRGPLEQRFRLSTVTVTTASAKGPVRIDGLDHERAEELVRKLTAVTQATDGDAT